MSSKMSKSLRILESFIVKAKEYFPAYQEELESIRSSVQFAAPEQAPSMWREVVDFLNNHSKEAGPEVQILWVNACTEADALF